MKLEVGDTVVIKEDKPIPRLTWKLGEVTNLTKGCDSNLQIAKIDVIANNTNHTIKWLIQKLIPLEMFAKSDESRNDGTKDLF